MQRWSFFLILVFLLAACGGQLSADSDVSGTWTGAVISTGAPLTLELTQTGVNLAATLMTNGASVTMSGTTADSPTATLVSLASEGADSVRLEASVSGNTMQGTLAVEAAGDISSGRFTATR